MNKLGIPKGMNDFSPNKMVKRDYIISIIKGIVAEFGYMPIETPAMEKMETLTGKYGDEGDRLIFKILNSGDFLAKSNFSARTKSNELSKQIVKKALRFDLTVPLARYVVQNQNEITFPFKRYQIQPVWRAERPQKGRFREFYQCDVDVIGTNSLLAEVELIQLVDKVFSSLKLPKITLNINNRKLLEGVVEWLGEKNKFNDIITAIDKLDKMSIEKVSEELKLKNISDEAISKINSITNLTNNDTLTTLRDILKDSEQGKIGLSEIEYIFNKVGKLNLNICFKPTLARGLDYYTGTIFEVVCNSLRIGSILGGGRYDNLAGIFGLKNVSGVGLSFGLDRIFLILEELGLFPENIESFTKLMFVNFGKEGLDKALKYASVLRDEGISTEVYPDNLKLKKQLNYANSKSIPFVALIGSDEITSDTITIKDMNSGKQNSYTLEELINLIK